MGPRFVDCHSHVVPSGDDGVSTVEEGLELCELASTAGTAILFATPHVWPDLTLTEARERRVRRAFDSLRAMAGIELRLGFELTPAPALLAEDPARYVLEGTRFVLVEVPFSGSVDDLLAVAEHIEGAGLVPLVAHPERTEAIRARPELAHELAERWPLQVNASSLEGRHRASVGGARLEHLGGRRCGRRRFRWASTHEAGQDRRGLRAGASPSGGGGGAAAVRRVRAWA